MARKKTDTPEVAEVKPWALTQADIDSVTDKEFTHGTTRMLPPVDEIPDVYYGPFKGYGTGNIFFRVVDAMYVGDSPPLDTATMEVNPGFTGEGVERLLTALLRSFDPEHQHKMAGMAYVLATIVTIKE